MAEKRGEKPSSSNVNKLVLKKAVSKRIKQIQAKAFISEREVYDLVRSFFKKYLDIDYEFTREEILKELRKVYIPPDLQDRVKELFEHISEIEHTSKAFSREELEKILAEFKDLVNLLIVSHYQKEKSFFKKLRDSLHKHFSKEHEKILEVDESVFSQTERIIVKMNMLLDNAQRWADKDVEKSKKAYKELIELYNSLDDDRKEAYYKPVQELFHMIKGRERS